MEHIDLHNEYKEFYYYEIEISERINSKITTNITFLTIAGSAIIFLWGRISNFETTWYSILYFVFVIVSTILFIFCCLKFFDTYSNYEIRYFSIRNIAKTIQVINTNEENFSLNRSEVNEQIKELLTQRYINDAIYNRLTNIQKLKSHRRLTGLIAFTLLVIFITFTINLCITYFAPGDEPQALHQQIDSRQEVT